jgi:hypothetical protein
LGEVGWDGELDSFGWTTYGFDLDGLVSTPDSTDHCKTDGLLYQQDGPGGVDNGFATRFAGQILPSFTVSRAPSAQTNQAIGLGTHTLLIQIVPAPPSGPASVVRAATYLGGSRDRPPCFDGTDIWPVRADSLLDGDLTRPRAVFVGHIADDVFVSTESATLSVEHSVRGYRLPLELHHAAISVDLRSIRAGGNLAYGVLTGALGVAEITETVRQLAFEAFRTCDDQAVRYVVENVASYRDIMADLSNGDPSVECDGISVGIGLVAVRVALGEVVPPLPARDPCAAGEPVQSDGVLAGTCDSVPANELAGSCARVERRQAVYGPSRASVPVCPPYRPRGPVCPAPNYTGACRCHEDCTAGVNARCYVYGYGCSYDECFTDDDCGPARLCDCNNGVYGNHLCVTSNCHTDADCPNGHGCSPTRAVVCGALGGVVGYYCHTDADDCTVAADCGISYEEPGRCTYDANRLRWICSESYYCETP